MRQGAARLTEILAALSVATDLATGFAADKALRVCCVATALGDELGLDEDGLADLQQAALLRAVGCTAHAPENAVMFDDDLAFQRDVHALDFDDSASLGRFGAWAGPVRGAALRERFVGALPTVGPDAARSGCEASRSLGAALGLRPGAITALDEVYERYDGGGIPDGRGGDALTVTARIVHAAEMTVIVAGRDGWDEALAQLRRRAGHQLDPDVVAAALRAPEALAAALAAEDPLAAVVAAEPGPPRWIEAGDLDRALAAVAHFVDLKSRFTLGHSGGVAALAAAAARLSGADEDDVALVRRAGLVHDVGRASVSSATWEKAGALTAGERDRVRLHTYWTGRVLERTPALAALAPTAAAHHERLDGSGYHRGVPGAALDRHARLLAAADARHAMGEPRPHRPSLGADEAAEQLRAEVRAGRLDHDAVAAVLEACGSPPARRELPHGLTEREVEVLALVARGLTNRAIAERLVVSPRTVQHHVSHIFDKIDRRTRAGAAVFAMEHGLVDRAE